jgi:surfactin synthase thioesterase subunit
MSEPVPLLCLPHAGGSELAYGTWSAAAPPGVRIVPAGLPGHGSQLDTPLVDDFGRLIGLLAEEFAAMAPAGRGYALFGHSFGSLLAFELARALRHRLGEPAALLVSGRNGPTVPVAAPMHDLPSEALVSTLSELGAMDERVLADPDLRALFLPIIRTDLRLAETYRYQAAEPLRCPVHVYAGRHDSLVTPEGLAAWRRESTGPVRIRRFDGGHFYLSGEAFPAAFFDADVMSAFR